MIFAFADCEIDVERRELRRGGKSVHIEPQVFDVLHTLIRHRDRVVGKDELFQVVWHGRIVSEATLASRISAARRAIGDSGERQHYLRTVARHGFRFCDQVEERAPAPSPLTAAGYSSLPVQATRLIGRESELAAVAAALSQSRLVTLTGTGGVGKTRLALQVAAGLAPNYPDGVWLVELAGVTDPGATAHVVAGVLGVAQQGDKTIEQSILGALRGRCLLLVLDNCEHLIEAIAALARDILAGCGEVTLLATSREPLMIVGEQAWPVPPLRSDGMASSAVELFLERARAVAPDLAVDADGEAVAEICRRLDGIPLAIELAAARTRAMSPSQIRDRLDERFHLLAQAPRGAAARHRTLRHAVQWSYDLLPSAERVVLQRVSVFAGGFSLLAAERVCGTGAVAISDVLDLLDSLVRKSLVTVERPGDVVRYGLLETIRQFAEEQLAATGDLEMVRRRHAHAMAEDSDRHFAIWRSPNQRSAYQWLDREIGNLRTAFRWASDNADIDVAARIASNVGDMARFRVLDEAANWASEVVDAAREVRHRRLAVLLTWAASSAWSFGRLKQARHYGEEALSLAGNPDFDAFVWAFCDLAMVACYEGGLNEAIQFARAGAGHAADRHDCFCLAMLPQFLSVGGRCDEAMELAPAAVAAAEATGIPASISIALWAKGEAFAQTDPAAALLAYERAIGIARQSGNRFWEAVIVPKLAALQARHGDSITALRSFKTMLEVSIRSSDLMFASHGLANLIVLLDRLGYAAAAATLSGTLTGRLESNSFVQELPGAIARIHMALGDAAFEEATRRGAAMAIHEGAEYSLDQVRQALNALESKQPS